MKPDNFFLYFESKDAYDRAVAEKAQEFADMADEWVMQKILLKQKEFKSFESIKHRDGRLVFYVDAPFDFEDRKVFMGEEVKINGKTYTIAGVEAHCVSLIRKGTSIGLWVR